MEVKDDLPPPPPPPMPSKVTKAKQSLKVIIKKYAATET